MSSSAATRAVALDEAGMRLDQILHSAAQPLTALQGTLELILLSGSDVNDYRNACKFALKAAQRVSEHFQEIRGLAQSGRIDHTVADPNRQSDRRTE